MLFVNDNIGWCHHDLNKFEKKSILTAEYTYIEKMILGGAKFTLKSIKS